MLDARCISNRGEAGQSWTVPATEGSYPTFAANASEDEKKREISAFIQREKGIKTVRAVEELLKNMFLESIDEDYVVELKDGLREYDGRTLRDLLGHVKKYGKMDDAVHAKIMEDFRKAPNMDLPIDKYFAKQEECKKLVADTDNPISDAGMVLQLTQHLGRIASLNRKVVKFKKRSDPADRTWAKGKEYFRECIEDLEDENVLLGAEPNMQANAATNTSTIEDKVRDEMAERLEGSFEALASAAVAKSTTIDSHTATIASLTKSVAQLTIANKTLTDQLAAALALCGKPGASPPVKPPPPPGFPSTPIDTIHILNTAGIACPARKAKDGTWHFVAGQHCGTCNKSGVTHIPADCFALPANAEKKEKYWKEVDARKKRNK